MFGIGQVAFLTGVRTKESSSPSTSIMEESQRNNEAANASPMNEPPTANPRPITEHDTTNPRPVSEAFTGTISIDDTATDLNLDDDTTTTNRNSVLDPSTEKPQPAPPAPAYYEKLAQKNPRAIDHLSITIGPLVIILFDIIVPCIIYYVWYDVHVSRWDTQCAEFERTHEGLTCTIPKPEYDSKILGYAIISFGFGELYILVARVLRLFYYRDQCAPLLSRSKWELDATSWVYGVAMICALIPFVVGSSLEIPELYLYSPGFLMAFLAILMLLTLIPVPTPIGINSHARGTPLRPFIYYAAEDFIAVDGLQDREFRVRYNARYEHNKSFRRLFLWLTLWWITGVAIYLGCLSAIIWNMEFHYAFGASLGILFAYIVIWAIVSYLWVQIEMDRERRQYEEAAGQA